MHGRTASSSSSGITTNTDTGESALCLRPPSMMAAPWRSPHNAPSRSRLRSSPIRCASRAWPRNRPHCRPPHGSTRRSPIPTCSTLRPRRVQISNPRAYPTQGSPSDRRSWAFLCGRFPVKCSKTIRNPLPDQNPEHHTRLLSKLMTPGVPKSLTHSAIPHGETGDLGPNVGRVNINSLTDLAAVGRVLDCVRRAHPFGPNHLVVNRVPHLKVIHGNFGHVTAPVQICTSLGVGIDTFARHPPS